jgi:hypothetical protein
MPLAACTSDSKDLQAAADNMKQSSRQALASCPPLPNPTAPAPQVMASEGLCSHLATMVNATTPKFDPNTDVAALQAIRQGRSQLQPIAERLVAIAAGAARLPTVGTDLITSAVPAMLAASKRATAVLKPEEFDAADNTWRSNALAAIRQASDGTGSGSSEQEMGQQADKRLRQESWHPWQMHQHMCRLMAIAIAQHMGLTGLSCPSPDRELLRLVDCGLLAVLRNWPYEVRCACCTCSAVLALCGSVATRAAKPGVVPLHCRTKRPSSRQPCLTPLHHMPCIC